MSDTYKVLQRAKDNVQKYFSTTSDFQSESIDDTNYTNGDQWTTDSKSNRGDRPMTVVNDAPAYKRKVKEFYKRRQSSIKVTPVDNESDPAIARVFQGIVDQIRRDSMGDEALDMAFDDMLTCGMGFCYVDAEYENDKSFNQVLTISHIKDPTSVFYDLNYKKMSRKDMDFGGWLFTMDKKAYEAEYPNASTNGFPVSNSEYKNTGEGLITLCRYYEREFVSDTLIGFVNPLTGKSINVLKSDIDKEKYADIAVHLETEELYTFLEDTNRILAKRSVKRPEIKWYILNSETDVKQGEWAGKYIPLVTMLGEEYKIKGKLYWASLVRWMKDSGRMYNYMISNMVEWMAMQPLTPAIGTPEAFAGFENDWSDANNVPKPYLKYNLTKAPDGTYINAMPTPTAPVGFPDGWGTAAQMADNDKKSAVGIQDVAMGMDGRENSGKAITARSDESLDNISTFIESRRLATHYMGLVLVDLIPKYYDAPRLQRILGPDGSADLVLLNQMNNDGKYKGKTLDIKNIQYDIYIDEGPAFASQRKENQQIWSELAAQFPEYKAAFIDKAVENVDSQGTKDVVDRIHTMQPEEFFTEEGEQTPEQLKAQLAQKDQQVQQQTAQLEELTDMLMSEQKKNQSQERQTQAKIQGDITKEEIKQQGETQREIMSNQTDIKESEIAAKSRLEVEMLKQSMGDMKSQIDLIVSKITA